MNTWFKTLFAVLLSAALASATFAQQQPVISVSVTGIGVGGAAPSAPVNERSGPAGTEITIRALAVGTTMLSSFTYSAYVNGVHIGTTTAPVNPPQPFLIDWTPPQPGSYFITIKAVDGNNEAWSLPVRYFATGTVVNSPVDNTIVPDGSSVVLKADATVAQGFIRQIQFYDNGVAIGAPDTTLPYSLIYTPPGGPGATRSITAQAIDNDGNVVPMSAAITLNVVSAIAPLPKSVISSPDNGAAIAIPSGSGGDIPISIDASSTTGLISKVELYIDGVLFGTDHTFPYSFSWRPTVVGTYNMVALTYDDKNNVVASTTSVAPTVTPAPTQVRIAAPPTVTVTAPSSGSTVTGGSTTLLRANATDTNTGATIVSVQFFVNGTFVGESTTPSGTNFGVPATLTQQKDKDGNVIPSVITALATNSLGLSALSAGSSVTVTDGGGGTGPGTVVGLAPTVSVTAPAPSTVLPVSAPVTISANAADADGNIMSVQFIVNGQAVGTVNRYPYTATWTPAHLGSYTITARATDNDGNVVTSAGVSVSVVDPSPGVPEVAITFPTPTTQVGTGTEITVTATASDPDGAVKSVQFFVNGQPLGTPDVSAPFTAAWTPGSPGTYSLSARATDNTGNQTTSAPILLTIGGNAGPTVSIMSPTNGAGVVAGTPVIVTANASDPDGTVASVSFTVNGFLIATDATAPYSTTWTPGASGSYSLVAYATDNSGNVTGSTPVVVTASEGSTPSVKITAPTAGNSLRLGTSTTIRASAVNPTGTIGGVQFYANGALIGAGVTGTGGYTVQWSPNSAGLYRLTATAASQGGAIVQSSEVIVAVVDPVEGEVDTVYGGTDGLYIAGFETGRITLIKQASHGATLIAFTKPEDATQSPKVYYYTGLEVDGAGQVILRDGIKTPVNGTLSTSSAFGTFDVSAAEKATFSALAPAGGGSFRGPTGLITGGLSGKGTSSVTGIVAADGSLTLYVRDGAHEDAGFGPLSANGSFTFATSKKGVVTGKVDPTTGFLTATWSGGVLSGTARGAFAVASPASDGFLRNLSTRGMVGAGERLLIAGFVVGGTQPKQVLIRATGPTLANFSVSGTIADPALTLFNGANAQVAYNNNWGGNPTISAAATQAGAFAWPANSLDAALLVTLAPGPYSAQVSGVDGATGVGLIEIYDVDGLTPFSNRKLMNVSTRGEVGAGDRTLIAGINITGTAPKRVLVRAIGPALAQFGLAGAISDPRLQIFQGQTLVRENDDWQYGNDPVLVKAATQAVGAFALPAGGKDAAILITLPPGAYTAQVSGANGSSGIALVEVYEVE